MGSEMCIRDRNVGFVNVIDLGKSSELLRLKCNLDSTSDYTNIIKVIKKISEEPYTTHHWIEFDSGGTYEDKSGWYALTNFQEGVKSGTTALNEFDLELIKYGHNCKIWGKWSDWTVSGATQTDESSNQRAYNNESGEKSQAFFRSQPGKGSKHGIPVMGLKILGKHGMAAMEQWGSIWGYKIRRVRQA